MYVIIDIARRSQIVDGPFATYAQAERAIHKYMYPCGCGCGEMSAGRMK